MKTIIPTLPNYSQNNSENEIKIEIRTYILDIFTKVTNAVSLLFWAVMGVFFAYMASAFIQLAHDWTMAFFAFCSWVAIGIFIIGVMIFKLTFKEIITIDSEVIKVEYESWIFKKRSRQYSAKHIQGLRSSPILPAILWTGRIAFDYGGKTFYFGHKLTESEAQKILSEVKTKFNNYDLAKW